MIKATKLAITIDWASADGIRDTWAESIEEGEKAERLAEAAELNIANLINQASSIDCRYYSTSGTFEWTYKGEGTADKQIGRILTLIVSAGDDAVAWYESDQD
jgi:hypothetical protein